MGVRLVAMLLLLSSAAAEAYTSSELTVIRWGDGDSELKICEPYIEVNPQDSTDYGVFPCAGPSRAFADGNENLYFALSGPWNEFKVFRPDGSLLINLSEGAPAYSAEFYRGGVVEFYVDSLCRMYFDGSLDYDYFTVVDTFGNLLERLTPYGVGSGRDMVTFDRNSDDILLFMIDREGYTSMITYTYRNSQFEPGGCSWLARDGNCYWARDIDSLMLEFNRHAGQDSLGEGGWQQIEQRPYDTPMSNAVLLGVDDDMNIYVDIILRDTYERVAVYDTLYELQTEIALPYNRFEASRYEWRVPPFMREDGNVYEFRCLDDGMHIIRWARE